MALKLWDAFVGGTYQAMSPYVAADEAINVFLETREVPGSPKQRTFYGTPGLRLQTTVASLGNRGWFTQDGETWTVVGDRLYAVTVDADGIQSTADLGEIVNDGNFVSFASNGLGGDQLAIVGGGQLKILDLTTDTLSAAISLPFSNPVMVQFIDGYFLINERDTPKVWFSALEDGTSWDALDFFARSGTSDNIVAIAVARDRVNALGTKTTTQFYNSGDVDTPFVPYPGTTVQVGLVSASALLLYDDTLYWIGQSPRGGPRIVQANASVPEPISTPPIEAFLSTVTDFSTVEMLGYEQDGHPHIAITCPDATASPNTIAFDARERLWHKRSGWSSVAGDYTRWRAKGVTVTGNLVLVGDYANGNLYSLDLTAYTDNGAVLMRERTAPYLGTDPEWAFLYGAQLLTQAGVGTSSGQGSNPLVELQISRDGARTWTSAGTAAIGALGAFLTRTLWRRLGRVRRDLLVLRVRQSDPVKTVWAGMALDFGGSTEQL